MKAGKFWTPRAEKKIGIRLGPDMRKDGATRNMDTSYQMTLRRSEVVTIAATWAAFQKAVPEQWWRFAKEDPYGGVLIAFFLEYGMSISSIEFCYHLFRVAGYLTPHVLEIGGGYGGMARTLLQFHRDVAITIVDLEPMLRIQRHYLGNTCPKADINFATEIPLEQRFGFAMNTRSLCEMDIEEVNRYFVRLDEVLLPGAKFYSMNHDECQNAFIEWQVPTSWELIDERTFPLPWKTGEQFAWIERTWEKT